MISSATIKTLTRYGMSAGVVLAVKLLSMGLAIRWLSATSAYLLVHVVIFFVSYVLHSKASFRSTLSWTSMKHYLGAVIGFKLLDYLIFTVIFTALEIHALWCVVLATIPIFVLRFFTVRRVLTHSEPQPEC